MAAQKLHVEYLDGRTVDVLTSAKAHVMVERDMHGVSDASVLEFSYRLAHKALFLAGQEPEADFEKWLDLVDDVDKVDKDAAEEQAEDPTLPVPQPTGSSG